MSLHDKVRRMVNRIFKGDKLEKEELDDIREDVREGEKTGPALTELKKEIKGDTNEEILKELKELRNLILEERKQRAGRRKTKKSKASKYRKATRRA
jgi:ribosomal protein L29